MTADDRGGDLPAKLYACHVEELGRNDVDDLYDQSQLQLREVKAEISAIEKEGQRLDQAAHLA